MWVFFTLDGFICYYYYTALVGAYSIFLQFSLFYYYYYYTMVVHNIHRDLFIHKLTSKLKQCQGRKTKNDQTLFNFGEIYILKTWNNANYKQVLTQWDIFRKWLAVMGMLWYQIRKTLSALKMSIYLIPLSHLKASSLRLNLISFQI